ncbi:GntR family transcriptional regulator [Streptomyces sp. HU2014]|uniref:GntR family transcriptional regulator n=1 Tax=Streptomyces sp. HU2014 TaxID=2939414 RepID=UPI00200EC0FD|nr:GntR family transcriptional regulator [Streptomyces sp. HU2014]UQI43213.1 GntR family transcriptional regulator [Streptomyces sp. HU2014]
MGKLVRELVDDLGGEMTPRVQRAAPPFMQIADHFRQKILDGVLAQDTKLPSIAEIAEEWGVATATAAKGIKQLQAEGYVRSSTQGTYVDLGKKLTSGSDRLQLQRATGSGFRSGERVEIISAGLTPAPVDVAEALSVEEGAPVVRRQRRYVDDEGVITLSTSWLPGDFAESAPELTVPDTLPKMTFGLIEERTGRRAIRRRDVVALRPVPEDAAPLLGIEAGTLALTMTNYYWDQHGSVTEYAMDFLGVGRQLTAEYDIN